MLRNNIIAGYINNLKGRSEGEVLQILSGLTNLSRGEKNTIYMYLFPKQIHDRELVTLIQESRKNTPEGLVGVITEPSESDIPFLIEAYGTRQYKNFIKHLIHSFVVCKKDDLYVLETNETYECGVCGRPIKGLLQNDIQSSAYGSTNSDIVLCPACLMQLHVLNSLLEEIEGTDYLTWGTLTRRP